MTEKEKVITWFKSKGAKEVQSRSRKYTTLDCAGKLYFVGKHGGVRVGK